VGAPSGDGCGQQRAKASQKHCLLAFVGVLQPIGRGIDAACDMRSAQVLVVQNSKSFSAKWCSMRKGSGISSQPAMAFFPSPELGAGRTQRRGQHSSECPLGGCPRVGVASQQAASAVAPPGVLIPASISRPPGVGNEHKPARVKSRHSGTVSPKRSSIPSFWNQHRTLAAPSNLLHLQDFLADNAIDVCGLCGSWPWDTGARHDHLHDHTLLWSGALSSDRSRRPSGERSLSVSPGKQPRRDGLSVPRARKGLAPPMQKTASTKRLPPRQHGSQPRPRAARTRQQQQQ
jgi:hypothetical protein